MGHGNANSLTLRRTARTLADIEKTFSQVTTQLGKGVEREMSSSKPILKFSLSLVAVIALMAIVVGVVAGRATGSSSSSSGGGDGGAAAGKKVDVIIKASDSSFWQTMLAGARKAGGDYGLKVGLFGPTSETDVNEQVQLVENSISRGADAIVLAPNSSNALNSAIKRARSAGIKIVLADTAVTTPAEGFIGTDNVKAGQQAGERMCRLVKQQGKSSGVVMIESSVAGIQTLKDRDNGFRQGLAAGCPQVKVASPRFNNNDINTAASQVNDVVTANPGLIGIFADNNTSGTGAARAIKDNKAAQRLPVVAFDTDPQENAALKDGSIDALVVQNPYFFGYQGVVEAGMAAVKTLPPLNLDPGAVVADKANMTTPAVQPLLNPPTAKAQG
jgi:ribose transport system substrate-binding protein